MSVSVFTLARNARVHVRTRAGPNAPMRTHVDPLLATGLPTHLHTYVQHLDKRAHCGKEDPPRMPVSTPVCREQMLQVALSVYPGAPLGRSYG